MQAEFEKTTYPVGTRLFEWVPANSRGHYTTSGRVGIVETCQGMTGVRILDAHGNVEGFESLAIHWLPEGQTFRL